jgi:hypothetical protein
MLESPGHAPPTRVRRVRRPADLWLAMLRRPRGERRLGAVAAARRTTCDPGERPVRVPCAETGSADTREFHVRFHGSLGNIGASRPQPVGAVNISHRDEDAEPVGLKYDPTVQALQLDRHYCRTVHCRSRGARLRGYTSSAGTGGPGLRPVAGLFHVEPPARPTRAAGGRLSGLLSALAAGSFFGAARSAVRSGWRRSGWDLRAAVGARPHHRSAWCNAARMPDGRQPPGSGGLQESPPP